VRKRGPKPKRIDTTWAPELAYVVGIFVSDGNLGKDGMYLDVTSRDKEIVQNVLQVLKMTHIKIGTKFSGNGNWAYRVQFKRVLFHQWLRSIGVTPDKSKTIGALDIPGALFFDFLRGVWDGDGTIYHARDKRWKSSYIVSISFAGASKTFLRWLHSEINSRLNTTGHICAGARVIQLRYARQDSKKLFNAMFYKPNLPHLKRKFTKAQKVFRMAEL